MVRFKKTISDQPRANSFLSAGSSPLFLVTMLLFIVFINFESADSQAVDDRCPISEDLARPYFTE